VTAAETKATYEEIKAYVLEHTGLKVSCLYIAQVKAKHGIIRCDGERSREIAGYSVTGYSAGPVSNACVQLHAGICDCERFQNQYAILSGGQDERGLTLAILQLDELSLGFLYRRFAPDCFDQVRFH